MNIALDFDQCYTMDVHMWDQFVVLAEVGEHTVYIVTGRYADGEEIPWAPVPPERVIYTNRKAKRPFLEHHLGIHIDIWIDDRPEYINADNGDLLKWSKQEQLNYSGENYQILVKRKEENE